MKKWWILTGLSLIAFIFVACFNRSAAPASQQVWAQYAIDLTILSAEVDKLVLQIKQGGSLQQLQQQFKEARKAYKQVEWLVEYYNPYTARYINGPALQEVDPEARDIVIEPEGFQVVEELLFPAYDPQTKEHLLHQVLVLQSNVKRLITLVPSLETTDAHVFDAMRLQVFRIIALGISGFDSPVAQNSIGESAAALKGLKHYFSIYGNTLRKKDPESVRWLEDLFSAADIYLSTQKDFASLDRMKLITDYLNPLSETFLRAQRQLGIPVFGEPRPLRGDAATLFAESIFDPGFYAAGTGSKMSKAKQVLGERLFYDKVLSKNGERSCASCHQPDKGFADGLKTNTALGSGARLKRNTPTLWNAALQPALFYDLRVSYLEDQARAVIVNPDEMHGSLEKAVMHIKKNMEYRQLFVQAFNNGEVTEGQVKNAIASYVRSLVSLNAPFDQYMRGRKDALTQTQIDGFNIFMGKAKCGTCHFAPLFNGVNPPGFTKVDAEILGVPATADTLSTELDSDEGRFGTYRIELHRFAFKTPTVRNSALTAPYMHNGVFETLEEVVDFYDRGGGIGLGLDVEGQTLPEDRLHLTAYEKSALVAFLKSLTDTSALRHIRQKE